jgi:Tfp pilus assembly protein PilN
MSLIEAPDLVLEWSPEEVRAYWPATGKTRTGSSIADAVSGQSGGKALILISRRASFVRTARLPNVGGRDLQMLLKNALPGLIPLPPGELAYDVVQTGDITQEGRLVIIGAVLNPYLVRLNAEAKAAGVSIGAVIPAGFTGAAIAHKTGLRDAAVVEEVPGGLNIDLISNGLLRYSRLAMPAGDVAAEVARTYAASGLAPASVLAAGGFKIEAPYSSQLGSLKAGAEIDLKHPPMNIELYAVVENRAAEAVKSQRRIATGILLAVLCFATYVFLERSDEIGAVSSKLSQADKEINDLKKKQDFAHKEVAKVLPTQQVVDRGFNPPQKLVDVLRLITNDTPSGVWLAGVSLERGKPFMIRGSSMSAEAVTKYLQTLGGEERLRDVKLLYANEATIQNQQIIQFSIQGFPVGNLPLVDEKKPSKSNSSSAATTAKAGA